MNEKGIRSRCSVNCNSSSDGFVGIKYEKDDISVNFPLGYNLSLNDNALRKDIILLLATLNKYTNKQDSIIIDEGGDSIENAFPFLSYIYMINNYYNKGYYKELNYKYGNFKNGRINWGRTIKTQKPNIQDNNVYYLNLVSKKREVEKDQMITLIHEYCVYESFNNIGWLFTSAMPKKPRIEYNFNKFIYALIKKLQNTFIDAHKELMNHMIKIIKYHGYRAISSECRYGTYRFEYIWERMVNNVYGIPEKSDFLPNTVWKIGGETFVNHSLEPDTIMINNENIFVLDSKYYKYGSSYRLRDLPRSTDINKQITYAEFIVNNERIKEKYGADFNVYNAFIMPYNAMSEKIKKVCFGEALSGWKYNQIAYERIQGILIDTKHLMQNSENQNLNEIFELSKIIIESINKTEKPD